MVVSELINKLQTFPKDLIVCVDGYEGGYCNIQEDNFKVLKVHATPDAPWYYGDWDQGYSYDGSDKNDTTEILVISR